MDTLFPGRQRGSQRGSRGDLADVASDAPAGDGGGGADVPQGDDQVGTKIKKNFYEVLVSIFF